jgi:hypothetical protein
MPSCLTSALKQLIRKIGDDTDVRLETMKTDEIKIRPKPISRFWGLPTFATILASRIQLAK